MGAGPPAILFKYSTFIRRVLSRFTIDDFPALAAYIFITTAAASAAGD